ncbi:MAG: hypothetical protein GY941_21905, partial [Planctomycetes bacterium]|nr:hypothetical protein [Planctomycetota bacterium]
LNKMLSENKLSIRKLTQLRWIGLLILNRESLDALEDLFASWRQLLNSLTENNPRRDAFEKTMEFVGKAHLKIIDSAKQDLM